MTDEPGPTDDLESTELSPPSADSNQQIGPYRLLQRIGEGGMGEVWLAEQQRPVNRKVALKVIKQGMDTKQVVARFEAERQALAMMDHPAVAKVFDAGTTPRGLPYFVMEYVKGVPITRHCDTHRLTTRERLELFQQVCEGVQHAHQKAIIHRDLKPTNVLVTEQGGRRQPKIIDFGVAKATAQKLTEKTMFTELGVLIGTPEYMSPEQADLTGEDVDTRTDVYSLGVILYELLVGALPFDPKELRSGGFEGIRKKIREEEPHKPSTRLSTLGDKSTESAKARRVDLPTLQRQLRGDLDWITMRALEKDRIRRYGSPAELAADIERHLKHEPVLAGSPSGPYRARKFVRRHRLGVGVAAASVAVLVVFAGTMTVQTRRIAAERNRAEHQRETAKRVTETLADLLGDVDPAVLGAALRRDLRKRVEAIQRNRGTRGGRVEEILETFDGITSGVNITDVAIRLVDDQILARAVRGIETDLGEDPEFAGHLHDTIGRTYGRLGLYDRSVAHLVEAVKLRERSLGAEHPDTLSSRSALGLLYTGLGRLAESKTLLEETHEAQAAVLGREHPDTLLSQQRLAHCYYRQGHNTEAVRLLEDALEAQRRILGPEHPHTLLSMETLAHAYIFRSGAHSTSTSTPERRWEDAEALYRKILEIRRRVLGETHRDTISSMFDLANVYQGQGRYSEAEALHLKVLEIRRRELGTAHGKVGESLYQLGCLSALRGERSQALKFLRQAVDTTGLIPEWIRRDPELQSLHGDPEFDAIVADVERRTTGEADHRY